MNADSICADIVPARLPSSDPPLARGFQQAPRSSRFDADDLRAISIAFGFALGLVLAATLGGDAYLVALVRRAPGTLDDIASRQVAIELLPWACIFTAMVSAGVAAAARLRRMLAGASHANTGFRHGA